MICSYRVNRRPSFVVWRPAPLYSAAFRIHDRHAAGQSLLPVRYSWSRIAAVSASTFTAGKCSAAQARMSSEISKSVGQRRTG